MPKEPYFKKLKGMSKEEIVTFRNKNKVTEYKGFKLGDSVKLKCVAVPKDHKAVINKIKKEPNTKEICFWVLLDSEETKAKGESWGPLWFSDIEKI